MRSPQHPTGLARRRAGRRLSEPRAAARPRLWETLGPWAPMLLFVALLAALLTHPWAPRPEATKAVPTGPQRLCVRGGGGRACHRPREVEAMLASDALEVLRVRPTPGGAQGASVLTLRAPPSPLVFEAKWRPQSSADAFNDPAAELIAYRLQREVLEPADYVVPPAVARCMPVATNGWWLGSELEVEPGTGCVLGVLSYWLDGSTTLREARRAGLFTIPDDRFGVWSADPVLFDPARFARDAGYRRAIASLNLVAHLIGHGDAHTAQFVLYRDPLHLFLVDNSVSFGVRRNPEMDGRQDLAELHVPALPLSSARRIERLRRADVEALGRVASWTRRRGGLRPAALDSVIGDANARVRREGGRVQVGLTPAEIDDSWARVRRLKEALERGTLRTFDDAADPGSGHARALPANAGGGDGV